MKSQVIVLKIDDSGTDGSQVELLIENDGNKLNVFTGTLPPNKEIFEVLKLWQTAYRNRGLRIKKVGNQSTAIADSGRVSNSPELFEFQKLSNSLDESFNQWLKSESFQPLRQKLEEFLEKLGNSDELRLLIQTNDLVWWQLPWQSWDVFDSDRQVEVILNSPQVQPQKKQIATKLRNKIRILVIQGDSAGINTQFDLNSLRNTLKDKEIRGEAELVFIPKQPLQPLQRHELYEALWDNQGWDIIFFAGHSSTDWYTDQAGRVFINSSDSLTVPELKSALRSAIALGLKLAIFNSCDGLGLAKDLADLQISHVLVMREVVADRVAQEFIKKFLESFSKNQSLHISVRQARESLKALENEYPCASWLPVICQQLVEEPITWKSLLASLQAQANWQECCQTMLALDALERLKSNMLLNGKGFELEDIYIPSPLGLIEQQQKKDRQPPLQLHNLPTVARHYQQTEFFEQVLKFGISPNSQGRRVAVVGEPGIGKTIFLQRIADYVLWESLDNCAIAIWISLANLSSGQTLENYLLTVWLPRVQATVNIPIASEASLQQLFKKSQVWLFLDGVDEAVSIRNPLIEVIRQIDASQWLAQSRVVLTCRFNTWEIDKQSLEKFDTFWQLGFSYGNQRDRKDRVEQFIDRWFANSRQQGKNLRKALDREGKERIKDLVKNPLQLSLLCLVWEQNPPPVSSNQVNFRLPDTKAELYQHFTDAFYQWKRAKFFVGALEQRHLNEKLAKLAKYAIDQKKSPLIIHHQLAIETLGVSWLSIALQLGWLCRMRATDNNSCEPIYTFFHATFQEYFAAQAIKGWDYFLKHDKFGNLLPSDVNLPPIYGNYRVFVLRWREVILLWFGREDISVASKQEFMQTLWQFKDKCQGFYSLQATFLAGAALPEFKQCTNDLAENIVRDIVDLSIVYFINADKFSCPYSAVQSRASTALMQTDSKRALVALNRLLSQVKSDGERQLIAVYLNELNPGNQDAIAINLNLLQTTEDIVDLYDVQVWLEDNARGNKVAIATLKSLIHSNPDREKQRVNAEILSIIGGTEVESSIKFLIQLLIDSYSHRDRKMTGGSLEIVAIKNPLARDTIIEQLIKQLKVTQPEQLSNYYEPDLRWYIAKTLTKIAPGDRKAVEILGDILCTTHDGITRDLIAYDLEQIGVVNLGVIAQLVRVIKTTENDDNAWKAVTILGKIEAVRRNKDALAALSEKLTITSDRWMQLHIADILGKIDPGNPQAIKILIELTQLLPHENLGSIRESAIKHLLENQPISEREVGVMLNSLHSNLQELNGTLEQLKINPKNLTQLLYGNVTENKFVLPNKQRHRLVSLHCRVISSIKNLGEFAIGNQKVIDCLIELIDSIEDWQITIQLLEALGAIDPGNPHVFQSLQRLKQVSQEANTNREIVNTIIASAETTVGVANIHSQQIVVNALRDILHFEKDEWVQLRTAKVLARVEPGNSQAFSTLISLMKFEDRFHPSHTVAALKEVLQDYQIPQVVSELKAAFLDAQKQDFKRLEEYLQLFWYCAENISYAEFYQSWRGCSTTQNLYFKYLAIRVLEFYISCQVRFTYYLEYPHYFILDFADLLLSPLRLVLNLFKA